MFEKKLMLAGLKALLVSLFLTPVFRDIFRCYNVVDRPGRRKVHAYPIPRVGGIPIACAYLFTLAGLFGPESPLSGSFASAMIPGAALIFLTGLVDDFFNLSPRVKLAGQILPAVAVFAGGLRIGPIGGTVLPLWLNFGLTVFWLLLTTNALNLIDGLDGLCGGLGLIGALTFVAAGAMRGQASLVWVALPLAAALVGFLFHNFHPATVFLGDSGADDRVPAGLFRADLDGKGRGSGGAGVAVDGAGGASGGPDIVDCAPVAEGPAYLCGRPGTYSPQAARPAPFGTGCGAGHVDGCDVRGLFRGADGKPDAAPGSRCSGGGLCGMRDPFRRRSAVP